jgi:hypothetical protein
MRTLKLGSLSALMTLGLMVGGCVLAPDSGPDDDEPAASGTDALGACSANLAVASIVASGAQSGYPASQAIDGNLGTRWSNLGVGSTLTADLGATKNVCSVGIAWYKGTERTSNFTIGISTDGSTFTTVYSGKSSGKSEAIEQTAITATEARYVRITVNGNTESDWASIDELSVTGSTGFVHPGVLISKAQLDLLKTKVNASVEPWKSNYEQMAGSKYGRGTWMATPFTTVACEGTGGSMSGCSEELDDARAAMAHALQYYVTGDTADADNAIAIMNAWSHKLVSHTGSNAPLQAGWAAENFTRAAEIIRYTSTRWASADIAKFTSMLTSVFLPLIKNGWKYGNGNWDLTMIDGTMAIAVFTDDRATFDNAVSLWKTRVPEYIYLTSDGEFPVRPSTASTNDEVLALWIWPSTKVSGVSHPKYPFVNGLVQETCRDFNHVSLGLTSMSDAAETAWIQGEDLYSYSDFESRISKAIEFHSNYLNGATLPSWLCGGESAHRGSGSNPTVGFLAKDPYSVSLNYEVAYNHYVNRLGLSLPATKQAILTINDNGSDYRNKVGPTAIWENFTNAEK